MALKGMLNQLLDIKNVIKEGIFETTIWVSTFLCVVFIDLDIGLLIGVAISICALYIKGWKSYSCLLGTLPNSGVYVDIATHKAAEEISDVKIFRYGGSINFATRSAFKKTLYKLINTTKRQNNGKEFEEAETMKTLIIDLSLVLHLDAAGCKCLQDIRENMKLLNVDLYLTSPSDCVYDALIRAVAYDAGKFDIFTSVHDAVLHSHRKLVE
jgi:solute carrier family 26, other